MFYWLVRLVVLNAFTRETFILHHLLVSHDDIPNGDYAAPSSGQNFLEAHARRRNTGMQTVGMAHKIGHEFPGQMLRCVLLRKGYSDPTVVRHDDPNRTLSDARPFAHMRHGYQSPLIAVHKCPTERLWTMYPTPSRLKLRIMKAPLYDFTNT